MIYAAQTTYRDNVFVFDWDRYLGPDGHNVITWRGDGFTRSRRARATRTLPAARRCASFSAFR